MGGREGESEGSLQGHPSPDAAVAPGILPCIPALLCPSLGCGIKESRPMSYNCRCQRGKWLCMHTLTGLSVSAPAIPGTLTPNPQPPALWVLAPVEDWRLRGAGGPWTQRSARHAAVSCRGCGERVEGVFQEAAGPRQERPNRPSRRCPRGARSFSTVTPPHPPFLSPGTFLYPCTAGGSLTPHPWASPYRIKSVCI